MTITAFKRTLLTYLTALLDRLTSDHCLNFTDHPLLLLYLCVMIGSVRPMIGKGPMGLWGLSKGSIATTSRLIGVIDRFGVA
jgi:hypothetical protein